MPASNARVNIIGHRGARNLWPENSLSGFRKTRALGIEGVEFDVHVTRDGELVVIHDPTLDRTTEGTGPVAALTAKKLAATKLLDNDGKLVDEGVPSLDAVLDVFDGSGMELHIEIKTDVTGRRYPGLEKRLVELVAQRRLERTAILTCFAPRALEIARELSPTQRLLASINQRSAEALGGLAAALDRLTAIDGCMIAVEKALLAGNMDLFLARIGRDRLGAWVMNEPDELIHWLKQPICQITTDRPDLALQAR
jgi:glycerophosphoryl diester phosphodiesterase